MNRPTPTFALFATVLLLALLHAESLPAAEDKPAPSSPASSSPSPTPATTPVSGYTVKTRSHFNADTEIRNPFWPIGWAKAAPVVQQVVQPRQTILDVPPELFRVSSIALGDTRIAVINGKMYAEGDSIDVNVGTTPVRLTVFRIRDGEVTLNYRGREVKVSLRVR